MAKSKALSIKAKLKGLPLKAKTAASSAKAALSAASVRLGCRAPGSWNAILVTLGLKDRALYTLLCQSTSHRQSFRFIRDEGGRDAWNAQLAYSFYARTAYTLFGKMSQLLRYPAWHMFYRMDAGEKLEKIIPGLVTWFQCLDFVEDGHQKIYVDNEHGPRLLFDPTRKYEPDKKHVRKPSQRQRRKLKERAAQARNAIEVAGVSEPGDRIVGDESSAVARDTICIF